MFHYFKLCHGNYTEDFTISLIEFDGNKTIVACVRQHVKDVIMLFPFLELFTYYTGYNRVKTTDEEYQNSK